MKYIVVDVAAEHGGALTVLRSFVDAARQSENEWLVYISTPTLSAGTNVRFRSFPWIKRSWLHRLWFEFVVMPRELRKEEPNAVLSLQNLMVRRWRGPQVVYLHQSLPFAAIRFRLLRDPKLWIYQNVIAREIHRSARRAEMVVVQANWVRNAVLQWKDVVSERVVVVRPRQIPIDVSLRQSYDPIHNRAFFYPANAEPYKNHRVILEACEILEAQGFTFEVVLTITEAQIEKLWKKPVPASVRTVGRLAWEEVQALYARSILLFPSLLESSPLPPTEARAAGGIVLASDLPFSREILEDYPNARFFSPNSVDELVQLMAAAISGDVHYVYYENPSPKVRPGFAELIRIVEDVSDVGSR